jgi:hypothetical protein
MTPYDCLHEVARRPFRVGPPVGASPGKPASNGVIWDATAHYLATLADYRDQPGNLRLKLELHEAALELIEACGMVAPRADMVLPLAAFLRREWWA